MSSTTVTHQALLETINKTVTLSPADSMLCTSSFKVVQVDAQEQLLKERQLPNSLYFINSGFVRLFYLNENGEAVTTNIAGPASFITDFLPFVQNRPSTQTLQTVTPCGLLQIEKTDLAALIAASEAFKQFSLIIFEKAMGAAQERANDLATLTAEQRYRKLLETNAAVVQQVPVQYIASYLGIKPESLSRIRRQIIS